MPLITHVGYIDSNGSPQYLKPSSTGALPLDLSTSAGSISLDVGDVEIGAVELKDSDTASRLDIVSTGAPTTYLGVQGIAGTAMLGSVHVDEVDAGSVLLEAGDAIVGSVGLTSGTSVIGSVYLAPTTEIIGSVSASVSATLGSAFFVDETTGSVLSVDVAGTAGANAITVQGNTSGIAFPVILGTSGSEIGSVHVTEVDTVDAVTTVTTVSTVTSVTDVAAGSILLEAGDAVVGSVGLTAGAQSVGTVGIDAGTNVIGSVYLAPTSEIIGSVVTTVNVGSVYVSNQETGTIATVTSVTDVAAGSIQLQPGTDIVGSIGLTAGKQEVGSVHVTEVDTVDAVTTVSTVTSVTDVAAGSIQLETGTAEVGSVHVTNVDTLVLDAGTAIVGSVVSNVNIAAGTGSWRVKEDTGEGLMTWVAALGSTIEYLDVSPTGITGSYNAVCKTV